jgi:putative two-component system response regulator
MDGLRLCSRLKERQRNPYIYTMLLTSKNEQSDVLDGFAAGADDYVTKTVDPEELKSRIVAGTRIVQYEEALRTQELRVRLECYSAITEMAEARDTDTGTHLRRLSAFARMLAEAAGYPARLAEEMAVFAPMHDIGKVAIPDNILLAPRKLTETEWEIMKSHSLLGWQLLRDKSILLTAAEIAYTHHERYDGTGYPQGLHADEIPLSGRIVAIADVYDALRSVRPYKSAWDHVEAANYILDQSGRHFDPLLVDAFDTVQDRFRASFDELQDDEVVLR